MNGTESQPWVVPTQGDPVARGVLPLLGGPVGRRAAIGRSWWTPIRVSIVAGLLVYAVGWLSKGYCLANGWGAPQRYMYLCYSDIPILYTARGVADGGFPYLSDPGVGQKVLEYPVLTGVFMYAAAVLTRVLNGEGQTYFAVSVVGMSGLLAWTIASTGQAVRRRPWDALMVALAPVVALAGFINWDLLAVSLTAASLAAWSRHRPMLAGVLLGLAVAAKFYPLVLIGPVALVCLRHRQGRPLVRFLAGAVGSWLAVNLPILLANFEGWSRFYTFSRERGMDFGSPWYALTILGVDVPGDAVNSLALASFAVACLAIAVLALRAPAPPRLAALALLTVAAFVLTNKVYSPQYVLWVLPLAVLARPRWRDLLIWQAAEGAYFVAIWWYLVGYGTEHKGLHEGWYAAATAAHWVATAWFMALVVRDILNPACDPVRSEGFDMGAEDPGAAVLDAVATSDDELGTSRERKLMLSRRWRPA